MASQAWVIYTLSPACKADLRGKSNPLQKLLKSWIGMQGLEERVDL
jgi:hypothetical protein